MSDVFMYWLNGWFTCGALFYFAEMRNGIETSLIDFGFFTVVAIITLLIIIASERNDD